MPIFIQLVAFKDSVRSQELVADGGRREPPSAARCLRAFPSDSRCGAYGAPGVARTPDLQIRSLPLYPTELQARLFSLVYHTQLATVLQIGNTWEQGTL